MRDLTTRIRQARRRLAYSQTELAAQIGVNRSAVAQWERPGGSTPTSSNLSKLAVITSVHYEWLATGRGQMCVPARDDAVDVPALELQFYAHDGIEERVLQGLRKLEYWQTLSIAELVESLGRKRL
ncbi:MAG: helix-turn-helix transcriptional regulator, partial [Gammaproteobacteria bacterium]|nr:helix-turn-helix transcriptional regulator [Gammaproteobacteria bacterium]